MSLAIKMVLLGMICCLISCEEKNTISQDEVYNFYTYHPNGNVQTCGDTLNGKFQGRYKEFYEDGTLKSLLNYKDSELDSKIITYYSSGNVSSELQYIDGLLAGSQYEYFNSHNKQIKFKLLYVIAKDKEFLVSEKEFNQKGRIVKENSRVLVELEKDTVKLGETFKATFTLGKPEFEFNRIHLGNFDFNLNLIDSTDYITYNGAGHTGKVSISAKELGKQYIRGYMEDYMYKEVISDNEFVTIGTLNNWFEEEFFVEP